MNPEENDLSLALEILYHRGREAYRVDATPTYGQCVGMGLSFATDQDVALLLDIMQEALEDMNAHSLNEIIDKWRKEKVV